MADKPITTDKEAAAATLPEGKDKHRRSATKGLALEMRRLKDGSIGKYWVYPYRSPVDGKRRDATFGVYDPNNKVKHVGLKAAGDALREAKKQIEQGIDPNQAKRVAKLDARLAQKTADLAGDTTFRGVADKWLALQAPNWCARHQKNMGSYFGRHVFPLIGDIQIVDITRTHTAAVIERMRQKGIGRSAKATAQYMRLILDYAFDKGLIDAIPMGDLRSLFKGIGVTHMAAIKDIDELGKLMHHMDSYPGNYFTMQALRVLPHLFLRANEFRLAKWLDIDLDAAIWRLPALDRKLKGKAKLDRDNDLVIPLTTQVVEILRDTKAHTDGRQWVFGATYGNGPLGQNTIRRAFVEQGYQGRHKPHGFRHAFSTIMTDLGHRPDVIEACLGHKQTNKVRASYNHAQMLDLRRQVMQIWSDMLTNAKAKAVACG